MEGILDVAEAGRLLLFEAMADGLASAAHLTPIVALTQILPDSPSVEVQYLLSIVSIAIFILFIYAFFYPYRKRRNRLLLTEELLHMVSSRVPLADGLEAFAKDAPAGMKRKIRKMAGSLSSGLAVSEVMRRHQFFFGSYAWRLIRAAENSGLLPSALRVLRDIYREAESRANEMRRMIYYPFTLLIIIWYANSIFIGLGMRISALFVDFSESANIKPSSDPFILSTILRASSYLSLIFAISLIITYFIRKFGRGASGFFYRIPIIGLYARDAALAHFLTIVGMMLRQTRVLHRALEYAAEAVLSREYSKIALKLSSEAKEGKSLSESLPHRMTFPPLARWLISVGEATGKLPEFLERTAVYYRNLSAERSYRLRRIFGPAVLIFFGGVIGYVFVTWVIFYSRLVQSITL